MRSSSFWFGPRGAGIRRLTSRQRVQGNQYQKGRLIRHTGQSGHGTVDSGPKWLAHPRPENHAEEKSSHPQRRGHDEVVPFHKEAVKLHYTHPSSMELCSKRASAQLDSESSMPSTEHASKRLE